MRLKILLVAVLFSGRLIGQTLNHAGHLVSNEDEVIYKVSDNKSGRSIQVGNLILEGNAAFKSSQGIVTIDGADDSRESTLRLFDKSGRKIFTVAAAQII